MSLAQCISNYVDTNEGNNAVQTSKLEKGNANLLSVLLIKNVLYYQPVRNQWLV